MDTKKITIKKGKVNTVLDRSELVSVAETHDGIAFNFRDGLQLYYTNNDMPIFIKSKIKLTIDKFQNVDIIIDLLNPTNPIQAYAE